MSISTLIGKVNLSLFNGGNDQKFILQNPTILKEKTDKQGTTVLISGNLKTANNLFIVPSTDNTGFSNNSNIVRLSSKPDNNGKWLILGLTLNNLTNLSEELNKISF